LEQEMQTLVDNYACEWKEAVENPAMRRRFVHFVNAPDLKDPNVRFEPLREQIKAEDWNVKVSY
jgi:nitrite reductase (NADH) large subunit